ncbi:MAG: hypothetical protein Hals2KO_23060 [Halioglobus sp.]
MPRAPHEPGSDDAASCRHVAAQLRNDPLSRRIFLARSSGLLLGLATLPAIAGGKDSPPASVATAEDMVRELAMLGKQLRQQEPDLAAALEAAAREAAGIAPEQRFDQATAMQAQRLLTDPQRTARELEQDDYVLVSGWLLSHSEAGAVLLHASATAP